MDKSKENREKKKEMLFTLAELLQKLSDDKLDRLLAFMEGVSFFKDGKKEEESKSA